MLYFLDYASLSWTFSHLWSILTVAITYYDSKYPAKKCYIFARSIHQLNKSTLISWFTGNCLKQSAVIVLIQFIVYCVWGLGGHSPITTHFWQFVIEISSSYLWTVPNPNWPSIEPKHNLLNRKKLFLCFSRQIYSKIHRKTEKLKNHKNI